jgi:arginyl-tRNA synthetase
MDIAIIGHISEFFSVYESLVTNFPIGLSPTRKEFEGDYTFVIFPFVKALKQKPDELGNKLGAFLIAANCEIVSYNVVQGFLNIKMTDAYWIAKYNAIEGNKSYGDMPSRNESVMVEYCGPNTNKPLHLGHLRNILLGISMIRIKEAVGYRVIKANIINDRGIHICKSMYAWMLHGNGETPENTGIKGDFLVGKYYVLFDKLLTKEVNVLMEQGLTKELAIKSAPAMIAVNKMLNDWEQGDEEVLRVWKLLNSWVLAGFDFTYKSVGATFDVQYFESDHYLSGKQIVADGLRDNLFFQKENNSIWVDLTADGLDEKLLLRADGTSVYITQDIGIAVKRFEDYKPLKGLIYTVGNEQEYHFKVLKYILKKMGKPYWDSIYHLSYGMVELPEGKMKSREGNVVDADELIAQMYDEVKVMIENAGKTTTWEPDEQVQLFKSISLGALKYYLLKINATKNMTFNPKESIDLQGNTGPFIQYSFARTQSIIRKSALQNITDVAVADYTVSERELVIVLTGFEEAILVAETECDPSHLANYVYSVAKSFNRFYQEETILNATADKLSFRVSLTKVTGRVLQKGLYLLGIDAPEKM